MGRCFAATSAAFNLNVELKRLVLNILHNNKQFCCTLQMANNIHSTFQQFYMQYVLGPPINVYFICRFIFFYLNFTQL